jgi:alginate O-acetyltransferase complex protein AlgI
LLMGFFIVWALPNTQQILSRFKPSFQLPANDLQPALLNTFWRPTMAWSLLIGSVLLLSLLKLQNTSTFLYFQF